MSDNEGGKKSGYRLEYASSGRAKCTGPKPCKGTPIGKGELRFGSLIDFQGKTSFQWRHWGCVTTRIINNMKNNFNEADELDGFDDLNDEDQKRVEKAWEDGRVAPEDVPETAKKGDGEEEDEEDKPKKRGKKKAEEDDGKGVFKFEYASSARSKCKACGESIGKDFFRLGQEVDFRGNKSFHYRHWGCADDKLIERVKASYDEPSKIEGFDDLQVSEKEKVQRAWDEGKIPDDDKGPGEAVETGKKKAAAPRKKKADNGEEKPKRSGGRAKAKKDEDEDEMDVDEEKPKKGRKAVKAAPAKAKAAPKKATKKNKYEDESDGEDFGDELAAVDEEEVDEEDEEEPDEGSKKRKRAPASKGASSSKPPSKRAKPASSAKPSSSAKPASKAKPASSRGKKKVQEPIDEEEEDYD
ncbi:poly polymerase and DNA-ligase Zn-finger region-domain-containing protein [Fomes fomentarius]|nr:poly polymerase and DNA-ligase Zn-finger region-domain-containing protein [Fomes fomentarius]